MKISDMGSWFNVRYETISDCCYIDCHNVLMKTLPSEEQLIKMRPSSAYSIVRVNVLKNGIRQPNQIYFASFSDHVYDPQFGYAYYVAQHIHSSIHTTSGSLQKADGAVKHFFRNLSGGEFWLMSTYCKAGKRAVRSHLKCLIQKWDSTVEVPFSINEKGDCYVKEEN